MSEPIEQFEHAGCLVTVEQDDCFYFNPRTDWDNAATMVCFHSRYNLGDENGAAKCRDDIRASRLYRETWDDYYSDHYRDLDCPHELMKTASDCGFLVLPLYLYDHSGLSMNTGGFSCSWDSGQVGFIYMTRAQAVREWGKKICSRSVKKSAFACMRFEVENYDLHLRGMWFSVHVRHQQSGAEDSVGGILEDWPLEHAQQEGKSMAECLQRQHQQARNSRLRALIRNRVPLHLRGRELREVRA